MDHPPRQRFDLSPAQLDQFEREGYVVVEGLFTDAELRPVIDELSDEVDRRARELVAAGELSRAYAEEGFETRLTKITHESDQIALAIWNGVLSGPAVFDLIRNPKLLDVAERFCGPELVASSVYRVRPKVPRHVMGPVPWHQDSGYFEPFCDGALVLTVWLPLVDAKRENGCMWVRPRAHHGPVLRHVQRASKPYLAIPDEEFGRAPEPVCVPVRKGGVLLMTNRTPHASLENTTETVRWSMDLRYQAAELPTNAPMTRLEGESVPSAEAGVPPACYPPEADFLVRSVKRPHEVVTDPAVFHALRTGHRPGPISRKWDVVEV